MPSKRQVAFRGSGRADQRYMSSREVNEMGRGGMTDERLPGPGKVPSEPHQRWAQRLLRMVAELHKQGYQRLRIMPSLSGSGTYWRLAIGPRTWFAKEHGAWIVPGYYEKAALYSSADGSRYFGWNDAAHDDARGLALKFVERFPGLIAQSRGRDWRYAGWYLEMLGWAEAGHFPMVVFPELDRPVHEARNVPIEGYLGNSPLRLPPGGDAEVEDPDAEDPDADDTAAESDEQESLFSGMTETDGMAGKDGKNFPSLGLLKGDGSKPYLGDPKVVWGILAALIHTNDTDPHETTAAIEKATKVFCGEDPAYAPMGPWNGEGIGNWIRGHMNGVPAEGGAQAAVEYALAHLVLHNMDGIKGISEGANPEQVGKRMRQLMVNWTHLMLGIPGLPPGMRQEDEDADDGEEELPEGSHDFMDLDSKDEK